MAKSTKINILKGLDSNESEQLASAFQFVCNKVKVDADINIINALSVELASNGFIILYLDEITLDQLVNQPKIQDFFVSKAYKNTNILLMLEDIGVSQLPDYLHYFPAFELFSNSQGNTNESRNVKRATFVQVVHDMVLYIKEINQNKSGTLTIFIGPSDDNTTIEYQKIIRELLHRNHHLIPKILNPSAKEILDNPKAIDEMLSDADLCIHFIGHSSINQYPEKVSPAMKVNELVANYCDRNDKIQRIIYVPDEDENTLENVRLKILQFKSNLKALKSAELVQTPVEKFKHIVLTKIQELVSPKDVENDSGVVEDDLYFIYAPGQEKNVTSVTKWLEAQNVKFSISQVDLDQLALLKYHQNQLKKCNGVLIFSHGNKEWLSRKLSDILKAPGWGRKKAFNFKVVIGEDKNIIQQLTQVANSIQFIEMNNAAALDELKKVIQTK